jgi:pyruvate kinase
MQENPRPTRAEVTDVANAVLDGTDATMLSGESANGLYPVKAVKAMAEIDMRTEKQLAKRNKLALQRFEEYKGSNVTEAIGESVVRTAEELGVKTIIAATESGYTARMISKYRPNADIIAMTFDEKIEHSLGVVWGVKPMLVEKPKTTEEMFEKAAELAKETGLAKDGDLVIIVAGVPLGETGTTNLMKLQLIGTQLVKGLGVGEQSVIGKAVVATSAEEANSKVQDGDILVAKTTDKDYLPAIKKASGMVVEASGLTSHAAVVGLSLGIPVVVGATDALETDDKDRIWAKAADENVFDQIAVRFPNNLVNKNLLARVYSSKSLGCFVLTNDYYLGFIHESQMQQPLRLGEEVKARVIGVSQYGRLNMSGLPRSFEEIDDDAAMIHDVPAPQGRQDPEHSS